jgi:hypothetical protein
MAEQKSFPFFHIPNISRGGDCGIWIIILIHTVCILCVRLYSDCAWSLYVQLRINHDYGYDQKLKNYTQTELQVPFSLPPMRGISIISICYMLKMGHLWSLKMSNFFLFIAEFTFKQFIFSFIFSFYSCYVKKNCCQHTNIGFKRTRVNKAMSVNKCDCCE